MRLDGHAGIADALAQIDCADEGGDAGGDVHDGAAGEIEAWKNAAAEGVEQSALAPHHVGHGEVHEQAP